MITSATYRGSEQIGTSQYRALIRLVDDTTGTAEEWFTVTGNTVTELRDDASRQIAERNELLTRKNLLAGIAVGTNVPVTYTPPAPPAPTAFEVWRAKVRRVIALRQAGLTGTALSELQALEADVNSSYQTGWVGQL